jgi:hypothetical protein
MLAESLQGFVDRQQFVFLHRRSDFDFIHIESLLAATVPDRLLAPGAVDENAPHGFGGSAKEVGPVLPGLLLVPAETQPGFVNEGGGLEGLRARFLGHFARGEPAQFVIHQRKQSGSLWLAARGSVKNAG